MNLPLSTLIGLRYARAGKGGKFVGFISAFSMAGIALGVMALIIVTSVMDGFEGLLKQRMLGAVPHVTISLDSPQKQNITLEPVLAGLKTENLEDKVLQTLPQTQSQAIVQMPGNLKGMLLQGIYTQSDIPVGVREHLFRGQWSHLFEYKYTIVIGQYLAMEYGIGIGDKVKVLVSGASHYTPLGRMPAQRNFTVVGTFETNSEIDQQVAFVRAADLNRLNKKSADDISSVRLVLSDAFDAEFVSEKLTSTLSSQYKITSWHNTHGKLFDAVKMEKTMMWVMLSLIIAVAAFNIVSALVMMVTKKQNEVAILKTLGMQPKVISRIFTFQGAYNGLIGSSVGAFIGAVLTLNLNNVMSVTGVNFLGVPGVGLPIDFSWFKVMLIVVFSLVLALVASIYPARNAASLLPADVLRYE